MLCFSLLESYSNTKILDLGKNVEMFEFGSILRDNNLNIFHISLIRLLSLYT